ncbi:ankyrin repeat domain-containing protein, partial [Ralstonia pseudosolanacearum]|uniref:ankyrin repeat domain-containing protein n=1 Tax=Ralstonia pseudosolanacearum TaxID=1310165 RepID=UPI0018D03EEE
LACSTAWPRSLALSPSASPEFQLTGVAPPSNSIYATTPIEVVRLLLMAGAVPLKPNEFGETALDISVMKGREDIANLLRHAAS